MTLTTKQISALVTILGALLATLSTFMSDIKGVFEPTPEPAPTSISKSLEVNATSSGESTNNVTLGDF